MRGVTKSSEDLGLIVKISTHTPHARRDKLAHTGSNSRNFISTHTPHARRDLFGLSLAEEIIDFNSHASCEA